MTPLAAILIITSAFMHALWNFVSKQKNSSLAFFFITTVFAALLMSPLLLRYRHLLSALPMAVWGLIVATGIAQLVYFFGLAGAYQRGDISLAYPLVRALPVLWIAVINLVLGNGADIGKIGLTGMALITGGCVILPLPKFQTVQLRDYLNMGYIMAVIAAVGTTGYTIIDDQALRQLRHLPAIQLPDSEITLLFISLQTISIALMLGIGTMSFQNERHKLMEILHTRSLIFSGMLTGAIIMAAYGLVLASMAYVTNVSYVAAFRQMSIPIGAVLGLTLRHEPRYLPKIIGICIVSFGLVLVGIG